MADIGCEIIWVKLEVKGSKTLHIGAFYRPPSTTSNVETLNIISEFEKSVLRIQKCNSNIWLCGDFNIPDVVWQDGTVRPGSACPSIHRRFIEILSDAGMEQLNTSPTRGQNILDLFLSNNPSLVQHVRVIPGISDHDIVLSDSLIKPLRVNIKPVKSYQYHKGNFTKINFELGRFCDDFLKRRNLSVNEMWLSYTSKLLGLQEKHIPSTIRKPKKLPWITVKIRRCLRRKQRLYNKAKTRQDPALWSKYRTLKRATQKLVRQQYWDYVNDIVSAPNNQARKGFWSYIKKLKRDSVGISVLKQNGQQAVSAEDKATMLNEQFSSVFTAEDDSDMPKINDERSYPSMKSIDVSANGIKKQLLGLNTSKAGGPDNISARILLETATHSSRILQVIFQKSLDEGILPQQWKTANITPIYKKESKCNPANYRPVSLTCITCKVLEHIINHHLLAHLDRNNILVDAQHGFRHKRSCETQLLLTYNDIVSGVDKGDQMDILVLDFAKAFDKVAHKRLLHKLNHYGVRGQLLKWIRSFLVGRSQCVVVDGARSSDANVDSGVPQGTVLGPTLFLIFINDLAENVNASVRLFADDCVMYQNVRSVADTESLQRDLDVLHNWELTWLMRFNAKKCHIVRATHRRKVIEQEYTLGGTTLTKMASHPYLGIELSDDLKWNKHIDQVVRSGNRTLGVIRRNLNSCPRNIKDLAYKSLLRPKIEYAAAIWDPYTTTNINRLEAVQRRAARFMFSRYSREASVTSMLHELQWPLLEQRRSEARLSMLHRIVHEKVDIPIAELLTRATRPSRRSHDHQFQRIACRKDCYKYSFVPRTVIQWNNLGSDIVDLNDPKQFKTELQQLDLTLKGPSYHY